MDAGGLRLTVEPGWRLCGGRWQIAADCVDDGPSVRPRRLDACQQRRAGTDPLVILLRVPSGCGRLVAHWKSHRATNGRSWAASPLCGRKWWVASSGLQARLRTIAGEKR